MTVVRSQQSSSAYLPHPTITSQEIICYNADMDKTTLQNEIRSILQQNELRDTDLIQTVARQSQQDEAMVAEALAELEEQKVIVRYTVTSDIPVAAATGILPGNEESFVTDVTNPAYRYGNR